MRDPARSCDSSGFHGEVTGLGLADVIQLNVQIRLTGAIWIHSGRRVGFVFMSDGEVVHAEEGNLLGEAAFYEIMSWQGGTFAVRNNVTTTRWTVRKSCIFLLLEAHRILDERRHAPPPNTAAR